MLAGLASHVCYPLAKLYLDSPIYSGEVEVAVTYESHPIPGVHLMLGNDIAGSQVVPSPIVTQTPTIPSPEKKEPDDVFPICAVTRAQAFRQKDSSNRHTNVPTESVYDKLVSKDELIEAQQSDSSLISIRHLVTDVIIVKLLVIIIEMGY